MKTRKFTNLFKKLKRTKPALRILFLLSTIAYLGSIILLTYSLSLLQDIENLIRIIIITLVFLYFIFYLIGGLVFLITKKTKILAFLIVVTFVFCGINTFAYYHINKTYNIIDDMSKDKIIYTTNLIKLKDFNEDIKTVGIITNEQDVEGFILPQEYMLQNNTKYTLVNIDDDHDLLKALYDKEVDAIFITANYVEKYSEEEEYQNIKEDTTIVATYSKKLDNQDVVDSTGKEVTEPFTILLLGVDSHYDGLSNNAAFNGDSIMLISFNPKTLSATIFSIPRDTYVPIVCNNNKSYKINSAAAYGTKCVIDTIQNLIDVPIDYYVKINFKGVVALVNALGGITVTTEKPDYGKNWGHDCKGMICEQNSSRDWGSSTVYVPVGENVKLNGEQALAYSRNRHQWAVADFKRIEHQQAVVTAIANKAKSIRDIQTFEKVLNAISNNMDTNMDTKQMLNLYNVGKSALLSNNLGENDFINIQRTSLAGYDLSVYNGRAIAYTYQYYEESLDEIVKAIKENLEIIKPDPIKEFNFSVNTEYKVPVIGKGFSSAKRNETLPDFTGKTIQYVESWVSDRNISLNKSYQESATCTNDTILSQSVHNGTIVSTITSFNVTVCKNIPTQTVEPPKEETKPVDTPTEPTTPTEPDPEPDPDPTPDPDPELTGDLSDNND